MKRRLLLTLLLACLALCCACAPDQEETAQTAEEDFIVVGFSQVGAESDWRNANTQSMREALSEENGFRLIIDDAQQKQERQITAIRNFIQQEVDYIVLAPTTEKGWDTVLAEARAAGIPVIVVDRTIEAADDNLFTCWVGSDFLKEGIAAIEWLEEHFGEEELRIVHLQGNLGSSAQLGRTQALDDGLRKHANWTLAARASGEFTEAKGQELMESFIAQQLPFNVVYAENDNMAYGAINALRAAGIKPGQDVTILSFDASRAALMLTMKGEISYDVECNPLHGPRVRAIIETLEDKLSPAKLTFVQETSFDTSSLTEAVIEAREY